jgi:hypothetical protein
LAEALPDSSALAAAEAEATNAPGPPHRESVRGWSSHPLAVLLLLLGIASGLGALFLTGAAIAVEEFGLLCGAVGCLVASLVYFALAVLLSEMRELRGDVADLRLRIGQGEGL